MSHPAILDMSDNNTSFSSVFNETSFIDMGGVTEKGSPMSISGKTKGKKIGFVFLILLTLIGLASVLIYLYVKIDYVASLSGQVSTGLGNVTFNATIGGEVNLSARLAALTPNVTSFGSLWQQTYLD